MNAIEQAAEALRLTNIAICADPVYEGTWKRNAEVLARLTAERSRVVYADMSDSAEVGGSLTLGDIRQEISGTAERAAVPPDRERLAARFDGPGYVLGDVKCADVAAALRSPADGWRAIESAPKDRRIEIGGPSGYVAPHNWHQESAHWEQRSQQRPGPICWRTDSGDAYNDGWPNPTHWRPLPSPPAEEKTP